MIEEVCTKRSLSYGFYISDAGIPLQLEEEWRHEQAWSFSKLLKFYPPSVLTQIYGLTDSERLFKVLIRHKALIDIYSYGMLLLFVLCGGFRWDNTSQLASRFRDVIGHAAAQAKLDKDTLRRIVQIIKNCL